MNKTVAKIDDDPPTPMETSELNLYHAKKDAFKIISNRIRILNREGLTRKYWHHDQKHSVSCKDLGNFDPYDPIRCKLRVMPLKRAPASSGKNSDFYFIQASK